MIVRNLLLAAAISLAACSPQNATETAPVPGVSDAVLHPVSGLQVVPLKVISGKRTHAFRVEIAGSRAEQARGLMFRTELGPDEGMIFPRIPPDIASFWMKNTPLPLDIIFVGTDGAILNIAANTTPYSLDSVSSVGMTSLVFEIAGGRAKELGIKPGDMVEWQE